MKTTFILTLIFVACVTWAAGTWISQVGAKALTTCTAAEQALGECEPPR